MTPSGTWMLIWIPAAIGSISRLIWHYFAHHLLGDPRSKAEVFANDGSPVTAAPWKYR